LANQIITKVLGIIQISSLFHGILPIPGFKLGIKDSVYAISFDQQLLFLCDIIYNPKTNVAFVDRVKCISSIGQDKIGEFIARYLLMLVQR
jgi:hypothetical protein